MRYFEDLAVGEVTDCGAVTLTEEEIRSFAERYDPQPFHLDPEAAADSIFGGLVASGWHTAAACMRRVVEGSRDTAYLGSRGVDALRWHRPVRPGTTSAVEPEVQAKDAAAGRPGVGDVHVETRGTDPDGELLVSWTSIAMAAKREEATP